MTKTLSERLRDPEIYVDACDEAVNVLDKATAVDWDGVFFALEKIVENGGDTHVVIGVKTFVDELYSKDKDKVRYTKIFSRYIKLTNINNGRFVYETSKDESGYFPAKDMDEAEKKIKAHYLEGKDLA